jgi:hypothetical protein
MTATRKVAPTFRTYRVITEAIDQGIGFALMRAFKYTDAPITAADIHDRLAESLAHEISLALEDVVDFGD